MEIKNPATEEVIASLDENSGEDLGGIIATLERGQKEWSQRPIAERLACITQFGRVIQENKDHLAQIMTSETGKPMQQSINEINGAQNRIDHLEAYAPKWLAEEVLVETGDTHEKIAYEPLGVIANISAWNFPYNVGYNVFLYALAAGNAVLYKPSEHASLTGKMFEKYLHLSGIPKNVFACAIGGSDLGQAMLEAPLDGYFFTGSYKIGLHIAKTVAHKLVSVQLELGGKDPLYITEDVPDIEQAAINAAEGAFYNNGQSCCAVERLYVSEKIHDAFVRVFTKAVESYKIGDPMAPETFIGSLARAAQVKVLDEQVADAVSKGAILQTGGKAMDGKGYFYAPTVLTNCTHEMKVMKEESFGPVIGIQKVTHDQQGIDLMKDTEYGLTAAVFCADRERAMAILEEMNTGTVYWNCCDRVSPNVPWSGRKNSGLGATLSSQGIRAFVQPKAYHLRQPQAV